MIAQPSTSRIRPEIWARMTEEQQQACCAAIVNRDTLTKAVRETERMTDTDLTALGPELEMVAEAAALTEDEIAAKLHGLSSGATRTKRQQKQDQREHDRRVLALSGASAEYQERMNAHADDDLAE